MNVIGSVPDGWWRDRDAALARLVQAVAGHGFDEWVIVVADGRPVEGVLAGTHGDVEVRYAGRSDPDAADDTIVDLLAEYGDDDESVIVVTSDRGLAERVVATGAAVEGAKTFRSRVGW